MFNKVKTTGCIKKINKKQYEILQSLIPFFINKAMNPRNSEGSKGHFDHYYWNISVRWKNGNYIIVSEKDGGKRILECDLNIKRFWHYEEKEVVKLLNNSRLITGKIC